LLALLAVFGVEFTDAEIENLVHAVTIIAGIIYAGYGRHKANESIDWSKLLKPFERLVLPAMKLIILLSLMTLPGCAFLASPGGQAITRIGTHLLLTELTRKTAERQPSALPYLQELGKTLEAMADPDPAKVWHQLNDLIERAPDKAIQLELKLLGNELVTWWTKYHEAVTEKDAIVLSHLHAVGRALTLASAIVSDPNVPASFAPIDFGNEWQVF
jgi:hypothetical protein